MKKAVFLFLLLIATCSLYAQAEAYKSGSVLWKISGQGLSEPSYLLGTLHFKSGEYLDSIPGARTALQSCQQVIGEIPMSDMAGLQAQMMQAMMMEPGTTYKMLYSEEDYQFVNEQLTALISAGLGQLGMLKPAGIQMSVIALSYAKHFPDLNPMNTLDIRIQAEATEAQKPVLGLETADDQIHVLFGIMDLQRQADALLCNLKNMDQILSLIPQQIDDYNRGNLNNLYQQLKEDDICPSPPSESDALNKDRNNAWMKKLPGMMQEKSSFIAVGALHLAGEEGLLNSLEKLGYKVEAVGF